MTNKDKYNKSLARILIVDDEPLIRKILTKYLNDKNYIIDSAEDGTKALFKLEHTMYDLVLTDLRMPNMGGRELLKIMSEKYPDIPKIVLTGYGTNEDIIIALKTGAYDFLTKPITDFTILEHSIERALEKKHLSDERKRYIEQLKQINDIISMLNSGKNTDEIFSRLNLMLKKIIPFNRFALTTLHRDKVSLSTKIVAIEEEIIVGEGLSYTIEDSFLAESYNTQKETNISDIESYLKNNPSSESAKILQSEGMKSTLVFPLIVNNMIRGFLFFSSKNIDSFNDDHITFLKSIVGQIALSIQRGELIFEIEQNAKNLEHLVELRTRQVVKTQKTTIFALSRLAETRDPETGDHLERMRLYSVLLSQLFKYIGNHSEITNQFIRDLYDSSILHDIGKVGIPDGILLKDGFLSEKEFEIMKTHTVVGYQALRSASRDLGDDSFLNMAMDVILYHHERWDGDGYPHGLKEMEIPLAARIVAIADVYDALTSKRPYKEAFSHKKAIEIMVSESFRFDPELFKLFIDNEEEFNFTRLEYDKDV